MTLSQNLRIVLFVVLFAIGGTTGADEPRAVKKASDEQIDKLIAQLGSDDFAVREQATRQLADLEKALPALGRAMKSDDPEIRRGAAALVALLSARIDERFIREAVTRVNLEGLDLFIDRMVLEKGFATDAHWKVLFELTKALAKGAEKTGATVPKILERDFLTLKENTSFDVRGSFRVRIDGSENPINVVRDSVVLSSGSLAGVSSTNHSILFVNGDIKNLSSATNSIIICNGTIKHFSFTKGCVIYCNGIVEGMSFPEGNAIFVRGELRQMSFAKFNVIEATRLGRVSVSEGNTYINHKESEVPRGKGDRFVAADSSPLGLFQFFDPARAGLEFSMVEGDVLVEKLLPDKAFARAGLQKGDRVLAVNREKFLSADVFTRLLRRKVVSGKALFKVQRADRILEVLVSFER